MAVLMKYIRIWPLKRPGVYFSKIDLPPALNWDRRLFEKRRIFLYIGCTRLRSRLGVACLLAKGLSCRIVTYLTPSWLCDSIPWREDRRRQVSNVIVGLNCAAMTVLRYDPADASSTKVRWREDRRRQVSNVIMICCNHTQVYPALNQTPAFISDVYALPRAFISDVYALPRALICDQAFIWARRFNDQIR